MLTGVDKPKSVLAQYIGLDIPNLAENHTFMRRNTARSSKGTKCGVIKTKPPHVGVSERGAARILHPLWVPSTKNVIIYAVSVERLERENL